MLFISLLSVFFKQVPPSSSSDHSFFFSQNRNSFLSDSSRDKTACDNEISVIEPDKEKKVFLIEQCRSWAMITEWLFSEPEVEVWWYDVDVDY